MKSSSRLKLKTVEICQEVWFGCCWLLKRCWRHLLVFAPVKYPLATCSNTWAICNVSKTGKSVGSIARSSRSSWINPGQGNIHSYGLMVEKNDGNPYCLSASKRYKCCQFQKVAEKDLCWSAAILSLTVSGDQVTRNGPVLWRYPCTICFLKNRALKNRRNTRPKG